MIDSLIKGQRVNLSNYLNEIKQLKVEIIYELDSSHSLYGSGIKISAFCLNNDKKLLDELFLVNINNTKSPCNGIHFYHSKNQENVFTFLLDFTKKESIIRTVIFVLSMGDGLFDSPEYDKIFKKLEVRLSGLNEDPFLRFQVPFEYRGEATVEFFEIYYKDFQWKAAAQSIGHIGGIPLLAEKYGLVIEDMDSHPVNEIKETNDVKKEPVVNEPLDKKLKIYQEKLLDLSRRNPLINLRPKSTIEFLEPDTYEIIEKLLDESETLTLTSTHDNQEFNTLEKNEVRINRTRKDSSALLYRLRHRSITAMDEQGVNILYLAIGSLTWAEIENTNDRFLSPILLLPVELVKVSINSPYKLRILEDEIVINPALNTKLLNQFAIGLPELPEELDSNILRMYFSKVRKSLEDIPHQALEENLYLGIFSFNKLVLYNDLERYNDLIKSHPIINGEIAHKIKNDSFSDFTAEKLDESVSSKDTFQVLDADSSQQEAIMMAKKGASFVLQGPPGTGKSQTITNIIAECIADGKSVLFVSEKMAALEVVKKRLENSGLGDFCLELHGQKVVKKTILADFEKTLLLNKKVIKQEVIEDLNKLDKTKKQLNNYVNRLHKTQGELAISTYTAQSHLSSLNKFKLLRFSIPNILSIKKESWEEIIDNIRVLSELNSVFTQYDNHPWKNTVLKTVSLENEGIVKNNINNTIINLDIILKELEKYRHNTKLQSPNNLYELGKWIENNKFILSTPFPLIRWLDNEFNLQEYYEKYINIEKKIKSHKNKKNSFLENYNTSILDNNVIKQIDNELNFLINKYNPNLFSSFIKESNHINNLFENLISNFEKLKLQSANLESFIYLDMPNNFIGLKNIEVLLELIIPEPKIQPNWYDKELVKQLLVKVNKMQEIAEHNNIVSERFHAKYKNEILADLPALKEQYDRLFNIFNDNLPEHFITKKKEIGDIFITLKYNFEKLDISLDVLSGLCCISKPTSFFELSHQQELFEYILKEPKAQESWFTENTERILFIVNDMEQKSNSYNNKLRSFTEKFQKKILDVLPDINKIFTSINLYFTDNSLSSLIEEEEIIKKSLLESKVNLENFISSIDNITEIIDINKPTNILEYTHSKNLFEMIAQESEIKESWYDEKNLSSLLLEIEEIINRTENYKQKYQSFINKYNKDILDLDIEKSISRFENEFKNPLKRIFDPVYKSDIKQISLLLNKPNLKYAEALDILKESEIVYKERKWFIDNKMELINSFGDRYTGENTDWNKIKNDLLLTKKIIKWFGSNNISEKLKLLLKNGGLELIRFKKIFTESEDYLSKLKTHIDKLKNYQIEFDFEKNFNNLLMCINEYKSNSDELWLLNNRLKAFSNENKVDWKQLNKNMLNGLELLEFNTYCESNREMITKYFGDTFNNSDTNWNEIREDIEVTKKIITWFGDKPLPEQLKKLLQSARLELKKLRQVSLELTEVSEKIKSSLDLFNKANILISYHESDKTIDDIKNNINHKRIIFNDLWSFYSEMGIHLKENSYINWNKLNDDFKQGFELINFEKYFLDNNKELSGEFGSCFNGSATDWNDVNVHLQISNKILNWFDNNTIPEKLKDVLSNQNEIIRLKQSYIYFKQICNDIKADFESLNQMHIMNNSQIINGDFEVLIDNIQVEKEFFHRLCNLEKQSNDYLKINSGKLNWPELKKDLETAKDILLFEQIFREQYYENLQNELEHLFKGLDTDWLDIFKVIEWSLKFRDMFTKTENLSIYNHVSDLKLLVCNNNETFSEFKNIANNVLTEYVKLTKNIDNYKQFFNNRNIKINGISIENTKIDDIFVWFNNLGKNFHYLNEWIRFKSIESFFNSKNMIQFTDLLFEEKISTSEIEKVFNKRFYQLWLNEIFTKDKFLDEFKGSEYNNAINDFTKLDLKSLNIAQARLQANLRKTLPEADIFGMESSAFGILNREISKKKKHKPLRKLFIEIKDILFNIKPCFMMSPLSVSQFIDPEKINFDLVIFDEASQIFPEDAIGAIVRGKQLIVVGDKKQMPPSNFFKFVDTDDSNDDEDEIPEYESILEECSNMGIPTKMLQWHYRSKDDHLIAFSNKHFYHNKLFTFPNKVVDESAIEFIHVDGVYDMGGTRQNRIEAEKVANLVFEHFKKYQDKLSLGVITFSEAQQLAILSELERKRMEDQSFETLFESKHSERFFVKSIEHVQGDERDVIFFSIGYGKNQNNKLSYSFGPLKTTGGERRLNVAITRAKQHIKLVSSIRYTDLDLSRINSQGGRLLRNYLEYAELGKSAIYQNQEVTEILDFDSPFEEYVYEEISKLGYTVRSQVGSSGYKIDLAIVDPEYPGTFLLGVECDGAMYHSSKTARDRDRLRQQVLESLGWKIHRIWSRDWVSNQQNEIDKIVDAIEKAKRSRKYINEFKFSEASIESLLEDAVKNEKPLEDKFERYSSYNVGFMGLSNEFHHESNTSNISNLIYKVVKHSSPIHISTLAKSIAEAWQMNKVSSKIQNRINILVKSHSHVFIDEDEFVWIDGINKASVRLPGEVRDITEICKEELAEAALLCLKDSFSADREELIKVISKLFDFARVSGNIKDKINQGIDLYIDKEYFIEEDNLIKLM